MKVVVDGKGITSENGSPVFEVHVPMKISGVDVLETLQQLEELSKLMTKVTGSLKELEDKIVELEKRACVHEVVGPAVVAAEPVEVKPASKKVSKQPSKAEQPSEEG